MKALNRVVSAFLADAPPSNTLPRLETSWDIRLTFRRLRTRKWTKGDIQYAFMIPVLVFCFCICDSPPFIGRLGLAIALGLACTIPVLSQFWLPFMPIGTWLFLFYSARFIPAEYRPSIYVRVLPALETILYGGNLSEVLSSSTNAVLDLLAWIPYGLTHFGAPFVVSIIMFLFGPPSMLPVFAFAFGWMNLLGVMIQILFPTAPPWYQISHGLDPANYSMPGSAGGLARIDKLLGLNLYTGTFGASPVVFGAFPSLHSGCATMEALFMAHVFPRLAPLFFGYVMWIWWSTMYLTHHYFIDLIGGACLTYVVFYACKMTCLPRIQTDRFARWSYDFVETGVVTRPTKVRKSLDDEEYIELPQLPRLDTSSAARTYLPPMDSDSVPVSSPDPNKMPRQSEFYHNHHKTSSYHLFDGDLHITSASSPVSSMRPEYGEIPMASPSAPPIGFGHGSKASVSTPTGFSHAPKASIASIKGIRSGTPSPKSDESIFTNIFSRTMSPILQD